MEWFLTVIVAFGLSWNVAICCTRCNCNSHQDVSENIAIRRYVESDVFRCPEVSDKCLNSSELVLCIYNPELDTYGSPYMHRMNVFLKQTEQNEENIISIEMGEYNTMSINVSVLPLSMPELLNVTYQFNKSDEISYIPNESTIYCIVGSYHDCNFTNFLPDSFKHYIFKPAATITTITPTVPIKASTSVLSISTVTMVSTVYITSALTPPSISSSSRTAEIVGGSSAAVLVIVALIVSVFIIVLMGISLRKKSKTAPTNEPVPATDGDIESENTISVMNLEMVHTPSMNSIPNGSGARNDTVIENAHSD